MTWSARDTLSPPGALVLFLLVPISLAVRGKSRARSRARELRSLARHEEEVNAWSFTTTRNTASGRKPLAPFGLRAAQVHLLRCPSLPMLGHGLRRFALHLHPRRPQRGSWDFHHGLLGPAMGSSESTPPALLEIGTTKQLFVDSHIIESLTDARQVMNQATKHPSNPILKQDRPWEGNLIQTGTVIWDERDQLFKMWYVTAQFVVGTDKRGRVMDIPEEKTLSAYAVSRDGVGWEKPDLGFVDFRGSRKNNLLAEENLTPAYLDPNEKDPDKRFKALVKTGTTTSAGMKMDLHTSGDGLHWTAYGKNPVIDTSPRKGRWAPQSSWGGIPSGRGTPFTWRAVSTRAAPWE